MKFLYVGRVALDHGILVPEGLRYPAYCTFDLRCALSVWTKKDQEVLNVRSVAKGTGVLVPEGLQLPTYCTVVLRCGLYDLTKKDQEGFKCWKHCLGSRHLGASGPAASV
eukprot:gnl/TRDRNA2_/TRDRNA2_172472_c0_seq2.p1 gnl/TRDRNA2_/TRDRNA2_172472_c0~~gnl/TRDRNA2_/TRDRNA2_172472_c0_seq2.p1  ORF type:complete len:110 (-),score=10.01 gnl/TRDRNA2_/TRDRNA2_172472_c0_seq2:453-782(-)